VNVFILYPDEMIFRHLWKYKLLFKTKKRFSDLFSNSSYKLKSLKVFKNFITSFFWGERAGESRKSSILVSRII
jgi:hypothetical protein